MNFLLDSEGSYPYFEYMRYWSEGKIRKILKEQLQKRGDQKALAARLGFTPQFLNDVVNGRRGVSKELAESMGYRKLPVQFVRTDLARVKGMIEIQTETK